MVSYLARSSTLRMEVIRFSETSLDFHRAATCYMLQYRLVHSPRCEKPQIQIKTCTLKREKMCNTFNATDLRFIERVRTSQKSRNAFITETRRHCCLGRQALTLCHTCCCSRIDFNQNWHRRQILFKPPPEHEISRSYFPRF